MYSYIIEGGRPLSGEVCIQGSKNAVLPIIAASVVNAGITVIRNCPEISDVDNMLELLKKTGCKVLFNNHTLVIDSKHINNTVISGKEVSHVRASVLFLGAMLTRCGHVMVDYPGGCKIGRRPVDYHIMAFEKLGVHVSDAENALCCECVQMKGCSIIFPSPSVGATENAILAALGAEGKTVIYNAAMEPEIYGLCDMLISMGARIEGCKTGTITISGKSRLHDTEYTVPSDRIVAGTYICAGIATFGHVCCVMQGFNRICELFGEMVYLLEQMGCVMESGNDFFDVLAPKQMNAVPYIKTQPYPGFPTDMQSQMMAVLCMANGRSIIEESIFENRFHTAGELAKMGADIRIKGNRAYIFGKGKLEGAMVEAKELRGGASLIIAGLAANGTTILKDKGYINRGYENAVESILSLGGNINCEKV